MAFVKCNGSNDAKMCRIASESVCSNESKRHTSIAARLQCILALLLILANHAAAQSPGDVVFTEVMYDDTANTDVEWVEIHNTTVSSINISGWVVGDGASYPGPGFEGQITVPTGVILAPDQYLVLSRTAISEFEGEVVCTQAGSWALSNSGDNLWLYTAASGGILIDGSLTTIFPDLVIGNSGASLEKIDPDLPWTDNSAAWASSPTSFAVTGRFRNCTPGAPPASSQGGDNCANAADISSLALPILLSGSTIGYVNDFSTSGMGGTRPQYWYGYDYSDTLMNGPDVAYAYAVPATGYYRISVCGSSYSAALLVYHNTCPSAPNNLTDFICGAFQNCGTLGTAELFTPLLTSGENVLIVVDGSYSNNLGLYQLQVEYLAEEPVAQYATDHRAESANWLEAPSSTSLTSMTTAMTIEFWAYFTSVAGQQEIVMKTGAPAQFRVLLNFGRITFQVMNQLGQSRYLDPFTTAMNVGQWRHVAIIATSENNGTFKFYLDGASYGTFTDMSIVSLGISNGNLMIGGTSSFASDRLQGAIDEVRIWKLERTQSEIQANMNRQITGTDANLVGYWRMDEGSGNTVADQSGNGNTLTRNGGTIFTRSMARILGEALGSVILNEPNGGESWIVDSTKRIEWTATNVANVDIEVDRNYPSGIWETVVANTQDSGFYDWTVGGPVTLNARIRVLDSSDHSVGDTSDASFVIVTPDSLPAVFTNILPQDGLVNVPTAPTVSWQAAARTVTYDLFVWPTGETRPNVPLATGLTSTQNALTSALNFGTEYSWQVAAINVYGTTWGPEWTFTTVTLPDLIVSAVTVPPTAFSGQSMQVSWTVQNNGTSATTAPIWYDELFLSPIDTLNYELATPLVSQQNATYLPPGEAYQNTYTFTLPDGIGGNYYIFVDTDVSHSQSEVTDGNNLSRNADPIAVTISPYPDLRVNTIVGQSSAFNVDTVGVVFEVQNIGTAPAVGTWEDVVYLSVDSTLSDDDTLLATIDVAGPLFQDSIYQTSVDVVIPRFIYGTYFLLAVADSRDYIYEFASNANNQMASAPIEIFLTPQPDFTVSGVSGPATGNSGQPVSVSWIVNNEGIGDPYGTTWNDRIYLSDSALFGTGTVFTLGSRPNSTMLAPSENYAATKSVNLPNGISGSYYIFVECDADSQIFEFNGSLTAETNNLSGPGFPIEVTLSPWPDVVITECSIQGTVTAGSTVSATYRVENNGAASTNGTAWIDRIYLSTSPTWNDQSLQVASVSRNITLATGQLSDTTVSFYLPTNLVGDRIVHVRTDATNSLYEHTDEGNNTFTGQEIFIEPYPPVDLNVTLLSAPTTGNSGEPLAVSWTVQNTGIAAPIWPNWADLCYLSLNQVLDIGTDISLGSVTHTGGLQPGANYVRSEPFMIPDGLSGSYYVILKADGNGVNPDDNPANNIRVSNSPVAITLSPSPDFHVVSFGAASTVNAGQPLTCNWLVGNAGIGSSNGRTWYDEIYLSQDATIGGDDILLASHGRSDNLAPSATYTDSAIVEIPQYVSGNYYLLLSVDDNDLVYEHGGESNNIALHLLSITVPPPSDLVVSNVQIPVSAYPGDQVEVTYQLQNLGVYEANGWLRDGVYFSTDEVWDIDDELLGYVERNINIPAGGMVLVRKSLNLGKTYREQDGRLDEGENGTLQETMPGVSPGMYRVIVRADVRNNIRETDDYNNSTTSTDSIDIQIESLQLGVPEMFTVTGGSLRYYRVQLGANQDLQVQLTSDDLLGSCEIFVAAGRVPSLSDFDWTSDPEFDGSGSVLVPNETGGEFFIMVRNSSDSEMSLVASALSLSVVRVTQDRIGTGIATCLLEGAGFDSTVTVALVNMDGDTLPATVVEVLSRVAMDVRFDATDAALGVYSVLIEKPNNVSAVGSNLVTVEVENFGEIETVSSMPDAFIVGEVTTYSYTVVNNSNVDVPYCVIRTGVSAGQTIRVYPPEGAVARIDSTGGTGIEPQTFEGAAIYTYTLRDLRPGESAVCQVVATNDGSDESFPFIVDSRSMYLESFLMSCMTTALSGRMALLQNPQDIPAEILPMFEDTMTYVDMVLTGLDNLGLIDYEALPDSLIALVVQVGLENASLPAFDFTESGRDGAGPCQEYIDKCSIVECALFVYTCGSLATACYALASEAGGASFGCCGPAVAGVVVGTIVGICVLEFLVECVGPFISDSDAEVPGVSDYKTVKCFVVDLLRFKIGCVARKVINKTCRPILAGRDPNDIIGPDGYGDARWITATETLPYTIRFENDDSLATAPVQFVRVTHVLDTSVSVSSYRVGDITFGQFFVDVPDNRAYFSTRVDARDSLGVYVDISAGVNVVTREAFWTFEAIDPATGLQPTNPLVGFLLINDSLGRGQGSVSFTARARNGAVTGERIDAVASIIFDYNAPIETSPVFNTIDAVAPSSTIAQLPVRQDSARVHLAFSSADDALGSGAAYYRLFVSRDDGAYEEWPDIVTDSTTVYEAELGHEYRFYTRAVDFAGNVEVVPTTPDAFIFVGDYALPQITHLTVITQPTASADSVRANLTWEAVTHDTLGNALTNVSYRVYFSDSQDTWNGGIGWTLHGTTINTSYSETSYRPGAGLRRTYYVVPVGQP